MNNDLPDLGFFASKCCHKDDQPGHVRGLERASLLVEAMARPRTRRRLSTAVTIMACALFTGCGSSESKSADSAKKAIYAGQAMNMTCKQTAGMPSPVSDQNGNATGSCLQVDEYTVTTAGDCNHTFSCGTTVTSQTWSLQPATWMTLKSRVFADVSGVSSGEHYPGGNVADASQYEISVVTDGNETIFTAFEDQGPSQIQDAAKALCPPPERPQ